MQLTNDVKTKALNDKKLLFIFGTVLKTKLKKGLFCFVILILCGAPSAQGFEMVDQSFMMREIEDGRLVKDLFEIWTVTANLRGNNPHCVIQVTSFVVVGNMTHVFNWLHTSKKITEILPGIFKIELNGRLNPFSGLEVVIEISSDTAKITDMSGNMRVGSKGQSIGVFQIDRDNKNRRIPPIYNPSWPASPGK